jgi:hypothetical protein
VGLLDRFAGKDRDMGLPNLAAALRKERDGMQKVGASRPDLTPEQKRDAAVADRVARGAVDPTTLLTFDDVEAYTGDRIDDSRVGLAPSFVSVAFNGAAGTYRLASIHGGERASRWSAEKTWKQLLESYDDVATVDELGDAAFRTGSYTLVRTGDAILFVEVIRDDLSPDATTAMADVLLRGALANLPPSGRAAG